MPGSPKDDGESVSGDVALNESLIVAESAEDRRERGVAVDGPATGEAAAEEGPD